MPVRYEVDGHAAVITIDRPDAFNSIDLETWQAFSDATNRLEDDAQAWVAIVTGAGRAFSAGADSPGASITTERGLCLSSLIETFLRISRGSCAAWAAMTFRRSMPAALTAASHIFPCRLIRRSPAAHLALISAL